MNKINTLYKSIAAKTPGGERGVAIGGSVVALLFVWWAFSGGDDQKIEYQTTQLEKGSLRSVVSATGTLGALVTVEVGSQLSGTNQRITRGLQFRRAGRAINRAP